MNTLYKDVFSEEQGVKHSSSVNWRQVGFMTLADLRRALRGGSGLFFLFVIILVGWILLAIVTNPLDRLVLEEGSGMLAQASPVVITQIAVFFGPVIAWWIDAPSEYAGPCCALNYCATRCHEPVPDHVCRLHSIHKLAWLVVIKWLLTSPTVTPV